MDIEPGPAIGHNQPPPDPERLVDPEALPAILAAQYLPLANRGEELEAQIAAYLAAYATPAPDGWPADKPFPTSIKITDDDHLNRTSDFLRALAAYAGGKSADSGEVHEARKRVTEPLVRSQKIAIGWFDSLRADIRSFMSLADAAQTAYLREQEAKRRAEAERQAAILRREAEEAAQRIREAATDAAAEAAMIDATAAEASADDAARMATARPADLVRSTSTYGTTTTIRSNWTFEVTDLMALARAVADGKLPAAFIAPNETVIRAAIKAKHAPLREAPGLRIYDDAKVARR